MNPQLNKVFSKLAKAENKTELASQKVELALADNYEKAVKKYSQEYSNFAKQVDSAFVAIREIEKAIREAKSNTGQLAKIAQTLRKLDDNVVTENDKVRKKIESAEKDLGIKININEIIDASIKSSENSTRNLSDDLNTDINGFIKYVNKLELPKI
tara:strand:- start:21 stop:488 length:468 start_codon:yes stop_codon:yes gene_type:complete